MKFILNGKEVEYNGSLSARLLDVLRDEFRLTGVKCGCKEGECGACAVIMDDALVNSCMVAMGRADNSNIMTIEGFRDSKEFEILDEAFAEFSAVQCGYCIPGMILAAHALLSKNPAPTKEEIRIGISGNLCRCTGYNAIVNAIALAAESYPVKKEAK